MAVFTGVPGSAAPRDEAPTAVGTIVGVRLDTGTILLDVGFSDVQLLRVRSTDSTRSG